MNWRAQAKSAGSRSAKRSCKHIAGFRNIPVDAAGGFGEGLEWEQGKTGKRAAWRCKAAEFHPRKCSFLQLKAAERTAKHKLCSSWEGCRSLAAALQHSQSQVELRRLCWAEVSHQHCVLLSCPTTLILHRRQTLHFHTNKLGAWKQAKTNSEI